MTRIIMSKRVTEILYCSLLLLTVGCLKSRSRKENNPDSDVPESTLNNGDSEENQSGDAQVDVDVNKEIIIVDSVIAGAPCEPDCPELEWVEDDYHENYQNEPQDGSAWIDIPRNASRVTRGFGWNVASGYNIARNRVSR